MAKTGPTRQDIARQLRLGGPLYLALLLNDLAPVDRDKILADLESYKEWESFSSKGVEQPIDVIVVTVPDAKG